MNINFDKIPRSKNKEREYIESETEEHSDETDVTLDTNLENGSDESEYFEAQGLQGVEGSFDAKEELKDIRRMSSGEEKEQCLKTFKLRFIEQQSATGRLQKELLHELNDQNDDLAERMYAILDEYEDEYKFSSDQMHVIQNMTTDILNKNEAVNRFYKENNSDSKKIYEELFNIEPKGEVEVKKGLISLSFICSDPVDYARLHEGDSSGRSHDFIQRHYIDEAKKSGGVFKFKAPGGHHDLDGTIIGVNGRGWSTDFTIKHEEQHAINHIYYDNIQSIDKERLSLGLSLAKNEEEAREIVKRYCTGLIQKSSESAKDEIIAFKTGRRTDQDILETLLKTKQEKGLYDYMNIKKVLTNIKNETSHFKNSTDINKVAEDIVINKYKKLIESGIGTIDALTAKAYSKQAVMTMLMQYPLHQWSKVAQRMPFVSDIKPGVEIKELITYEEEKLIEKLREQLEQEEKKN